MNLEWTRYDLASLEDALGQSYCLYAFHHPADGDHPFYIGKAKFFGTRQPTGYKASARYNSGYTHLIKGMLRSGYSLYIAHIGEDAYKHAEAYEQELISRWSPVQTQKTKPFRAIVTSAIPWQQGQAN